MILKKEKWIDIFLLLSRFNQSFFHLFLVHGIFLNNKLVYKNKMLINKNIIIIFYFTTREVEKETFFVVVDVFCCGILFLFLLEEEEFSFDVDDEKA